MILELTGEKNWWFYGELKTTGTIQEWKNEAVSKKFCNHAIHSLANKALQAQNGSNISFYNPHVFDKFMKHFGKYVEIVDLRV